MSLIQTFSLRRCLGATNILLNRWDMGNEFWQEQNGDLLHFRLLERVKKGDNSIEEKVERLPDSPVPLEARLIQLQSWSFVSESKTRQEPQQKEQQEPLKKPTQPSSPKDKRKSSSSRIDREQQTLSDQESSATSSSQQSLTTPNLHSELWSPLAQWIPPHALYQPSLHHQAVLELSEQPIHSSLSQRVQAPYSRRQQDRRPYSKYTPHSKGPSSKTPLLATPAVH